jgi:DNA-binding MarR family transcriptional regulator
MSQANELEIPVAVTRDDPELAARLRVAVTRLARRLRQEGQSGLTPSMASALVTVERHGPMTPSELAAAEGVQRPTATRVLASLEAAGMIVREPDPADGRSQRVRVSPAGARVLGRLRTRKTAFLARRLQRLDADEAATLARAADLMERLLEERP